MTTTTSVDGRAFNPGALDAETMLPSLGVLAGMLRSAGFDEAAAAHALGAASPADFLSSPAMYAFYTDWPVRGGKCAVLTSLFGLNRTVDPAWVRRALPGELLSVLFTLGFLTEADDGLRSTVSITPFRSRYFISDRLFANPEPHVVTLDAPRDAVMPPHLSSLLALEIIEEFAGSVLDVGCGSGFLALNMPAGCERVAGVDLNPRCVAYAHANSVLNSIPASFEVGDFALLLAASPERYDHFIFNAPTLPKIGIEDVELGQTTAERLLRVAVDVGRKLLRSGGEAHVVAAVEVPAGCASVAEAVRHWLSDLDVRKILVREFDAPQMNVSARELESRRLSGRNILVRNSAEAKGLLDALAVRGVGSVRVARVTLRVD